MIALGPQFGTISLGGVLIAVVEILRGIANYIQQESADSNNIVMARAEWNLKHTHNRPTDPPRVNCAGGSSDDSRPQSALTRVPAPAHRAQCLLGYIVAGFLFCVAGLLDAVTKFATIRAAMTGDHFWEAAVGAKDLLLRNALDAFVVWDFPGTILGFCALIVAAAFGALVGGAVNLSVRIEAAAWGASVQARARCVCLSTTLRCPLTGATAAFPACATIRRVMTSAGARHICRRRRTQHTRCW